MKTTMLDQKQLKQLISKHNYFEIVANFTLRPIADSTLNVREVAVLTEFYRERFVKVCEFNTLNTVRTLLRIL